jgi:hypothetical protein
MTAVPVSNTQCRSCSGKSANAERGARGSTTNGPDRGARSTVSALGSSRERAPRSRGRSVPSSPDRTRRLALSSGNVDLSSVMTSAATASTVSAFCRLDEISASRASRSTFCRRK